MNFLRQIIEGFTGWIDSVATTINSISDRMRSQRHVQLIEEERGTFTFHVLNNVKNSNLSDYRVRIANGSIVDVLPPIWATVLHGSRIELVLQPSRFLFRPLELPKRAAEYLEGIVRSQIDRLTPWAANDAIYSWTPPIDAANDRIHLMIAATARAMVAPYLQAIAALGSASIFVTTTVLNPDSHAAPIKVYEQRMRSAIDVARIRSILLAVFLLSGLLATISMGVSAMIASSLGSEQQELLRKISARKAAMRSVNDLSGGSALQMLERRKQMTPSSVIVLEAMSALLPDDTYVTELRVDGEKLQIVGITSDAPSLIQLIEQSRHFARATFFAPTTRSLGEIKDRFHIEARINPVIASGS
jgi:general secretion pathway protein L